jgi:hypothetical protein
MINYEINQGIATITLNRPDKFNSFNRPMADAFNAALQEGHPHQAAAWKLVLDRVAPLSAFDTTKGSNAAAPSISINISGLTSPSVETVEDVTDVYIKDLDTE